MTSKVLAVVDPRLQLPQSAGIVAAALEEPEAGYRVRVLTRDASAPAAVALKAKGVEVVEGHLDDPASVTRAFEGADAAFCVTYYPEHFSPAKEIEHSHTLARSAAAARVRHALWITFEEMSDFDPTKDMSNYDPTQRLGEPDRIFLELKVPTTFILSSFFWENLIYSGAGPKRRANGRLAFSMPYGDNKIPGQAGVDVGRCAFGMLKRGPEFIGQTVGVAGEHLTGAEMAAAIADALGEPVDYVSLPPGVYSTPEFPGLDDPNNIQYKIRFDKEFRGIRDVERSRALNPKLLSFRGWLGEHASELPLEPVA